MKSKTAKRTSTRGLKKYVSSRAVNDGAPDTTSCPKDSVERKVGGNGDLRM